MGNFSMTPTVYSTSRRSLCCVWKIFPPTHCTHEYLASVHHRVLASASVLLRVRLRVCLPICVSFRRSVCPSVHLQVGPCGACVCGSGINIYIAVVVGKRQSAEVAIVRVLTYIAVRTLLFVPYNKRTLRSFSRIDVY